jgi:hypothetical protein
VQGTVSVTCNDNEVLVSALCNGNATPRVSERNAACDPGDGVVGLCMRR